MEYWFIVWKYGFLLHLLNKILSMLATGYFLKIAKINSQQKNQSVLIAKISSHKTQKMANPPA